jgi:5'-nucleotidase
MNRTDLTSIARSALLAGAASAALLAVGCKDPTATPPLKGQIHLTFIHTADIHSRLFPYDLQLGAVDAGLGLGADGQVINVGGAARVSHIVGRERARADRVLHLDGGDSFQGAPVFNFFSGEAEVKAMSAMGTDVSLVANHEFDRGALNLGIQLEKWATFPVLAANYQFQDPSQPGASPLGGIVRPFTVFDLQGLKVGVIGMGNLSSLTSIFNIPNRLGITPLNTTEVAQFYVDLLRPEVDVVVVLSHLGLDVDETMIQTTTGIDVVMGGHNHIVLQPPKQLQDCSAYNETEADGTVRNFILLDQGTQSGEGAVGCHTNADCGSNGYCFGDNDAIAAGQAVCKGKRYCQPRNVLLSHSGAFAKYVGRLDLVVSNDTADFAGAPYDPVNGFEVISSDYNLLPVTDQTPPDPVVEAVLQPYEQGLDALGNLQLLVGYALDGSKRNSTGGGDSPLGNLIGTAMWLRLGIQTDFALTNTTGIRTDLVPGPVAIEQMYNIFPFDNSITKMELSGIEVQELMDFVARRSAGRGCVSQIQIAGARVVMDCTSVACDFLDCTSPPNPPGLTCDPNGGVCTPAMLCAGKPACPDGLFCDPNSGLCLQGVAGVSRNIYIGPYVDGQGNPVGCSSDKDCPDAPKKAGDPLNTNQCDPVGHVCYQPIQPFASYELATSDYLAGGGSGFLVLKQNTTQNNTHVEQRDALIDYIRAGAPCGADANGKLTSCSTDTDCTNLPSLGIDYACACPESVLPLAAGLCQTGPAGCAGKGQCVLAQCRDDVANFQDATCTGAPTASIKAACEAALEPCVAGGEQCKYLACINQGLGSYSDNRIEMVGQ